MSNTLIEAPNGTYLRAAHITAVSPLFESVELGTDAFAVYVIGTDEPFLFAEPFSGEGPKNSAKRRAATKSAHQEFLLAWGRAVDGDFFPFKTN